jgi:hypothetical protein
MPIPAFTMADFRVHDADSGVHTPPIRAFTLRRSSRSRTLGARTGAALAAIASVRVPAWPPAWASWRSASPRFDADPAAATWANVARDRAVRECGRQLRSESF